MIGLDTNVLVRFLVGDDVDQAKRAEEFIEQAANRGPLFINQIVLCELIWVLSYAYDYSKATLVDLLEKMLSTKQFEIEEREVVWSALALYKKTKADFSDCLLGTKNHQLGCTYTATFDQKALTCHFYKPC